MITLPTRRDRDTGVVLFFLSLVFYYAVPALAYEFGYSYGTVAHISTPVGLLLMLLGVACLFLARKTIKVEPGLLRIKDGFWSRPLQLRFEGSPMIRLSHHEQERGHHSDEVWTVHLIDGHTQYLIDRRVGQHSQVRSLAERLAKAVDGSLMEVHEGQSYTFAPGEMDLPFHERAKRYPALMGAPVDEPSDKVIAFRQDASGVEVSWSFFRSGLLWEVLVVSGLLAGAAFVPLPGGPDGKGFTLYQAEHAQGDYRYFVGVALFTMVSLVLLSGYRSRIHLGAEEGAVARSTVWGIPVRTAKIPLSRLEHVGVSVTSRGPYLQLISDETIIKEQFPSTHIARWVAWRMRSYLVELPPTAATGSKEHLEG